jgi:4-amino-4-deoxy-L-arabinose transferase-like glycosyltransferase
MAQRESSAKIARLSSTRSTSDGDERDTDAALARFARFAPAIFALALVLAMVVIVRSLPSTPVSPHSDDGFYLKFMQRVHDEGLAAFPKLFREWNGDPHDWIYPPPSRVGFVVVSALWASFFGASFASLQELSMASFVASSIATYLFARRQFGEPRALFIGILWAFSPLLMGISRLALTDSFIALCTSITAWLFLELVDEPSSWRRRILFMSAFGFTVLVKELTVLLLGPFAAFVLVERFGRRRALDLRQFALWLALPGVVIAPIFVLAAGRMSTLLEQIRIVLASPATNEYAIQFGSGPWFRYVVDFLCLSPFTTLLSIAFLGVLAVRLKNGEYDRRLVFLGLIAAGLLLEFSFFTKNLRYAVLFELPIRAFSACLVWELFRSRSSVRSLIASSAAVVLLCIADCRTFDLYWVRYRGYDPMTYELLGMRHMVPYPER